MFTLRFHNPQEWSLHGYRQESSAINTGFFQVAFDKIQMSSVTNNQMLLTPRQHLGLHFSTWTLLRSRVSRRTPRSTSSLRKFDAESRNLGRHSMLATIFASGQPGTPLEVSRLASISSALELPEMWLASSYARIVPRPPNIIPFTSSSLKPD